MDFIIQPDVPSELTTPFISLVGSSLANVSIDGVYTELGAIAINSDSVSLTDNIIISTENPILGDIIEENIPTLSIDPITNTITLLSTAPQDNTPILIRNAFGMTLDNVDIKSNTIYFVKESSGNTFKLATNIYGNALNITSTSDFPITIYETPIVNASVLQPNTLKYDVINSDGIYAQSIYRTIMIKNDASVSIGVGSSIAISDVKISNSLSYDYQLLYRIPFKLGKIVSNPYPCVTPEYRQPNVILPQNRDSRYIRADGSIPFSDDQTMANHKLTNVGNAEDLGDAVNLGQLLNIISSISAPISIYNVVESGNIEDVDQTDYTAVKWFVSVTDLTTEDTYASEVVAVNTTSGIVFNESNLVGTGDVYTTTAYENSGNIVISINNTGLNDLGVTVVRFKIS